MSGQRDGDQRYINHVIRLQIKSEPILYLQFLHQRVCIECKQLFSPLPHSIDMCVDCFLQLDTVYAMEWPAKE
jgi:hypothetical protein